jgi:hypothetical protein
VLNNVLIDLYGKMGTNQAVIAISSMKPTAKILIAMLTIAATCFGLLKTAAPRFFLDVNQRRISLAIGIVVRGVEYGGRCSPTMVGTSAPLVQACAASEKYQKATLARLALFLPMTIVGVILLCAVEAEQPVALQQALDEFTPCLAGSTPRMTRNCAKLPSAAASRTSASTPI